MLTKLHEADWPTDIDELPVALKGHLGAMPYRGLDLSGAGYEFVGAGPCMLPGEPSAHLIYRAGEGDQAKSVSLWLRPDDNRFDIPENQTHKVTPKGSDDSIVIWRHSGVIYYLLGDQAETAAQQFSGRE